MELSDVNPCAPEKLEKVKREREDNDAAIIRNWERSNCAGVEDDDDGEDCEGEDCEGEDDPEDATESSVRLRAKSWSGHCCRFSDASRWITKHEQGQGKPSKDLSECVTRALRLPPRLKRVFEPEEESHEEISEADLLAADPPAAWQRLEPKQKDLLLKAMESVCTDVEMAPLWAAHPPVSRLSLPSDEDYLGATLHVELAAAYLRLGEEGV